MQAADSPVPRNDPEPPRVDGVFQQLDAPQHACAVALHALWQRLCLPDGIPCRTDFSFETVGDAGLLGHIFVIEPTGDGRDWRYRLLGSEITWMFGRDVTGIPFREHFAPGEAEVCIALSNHVAETRIPVFLRGSIRSGSYSGVFETMSLPVWSRRRDAVWLIGGSFVER